MYCYKQTGTDPNLWTVGFYDPCGEWNPESDHTSWEAAAERVHWLNGVATRVHFAAQSPITQET